MAAAEQVNLVPPAPAPGVEEGGGTALPELSPAERGERRLELERLAEGGLPAAREAMVALMGRDDFTLDISPYGGSIPEAQANNDRDAIQINTLLQKHNPVLIARRLQAARDADLRASSSCSICMEPWTDDRTLTIASLGCGHSFHTNCFEGLRSQRPTRVCTLCYNDPACPDQVSAEHPWMVRPNTVP